MLNNKVALLIQCACLFIVTVTTSQVAQAHRNKHDSNDTRSTHYWYWAEASFSSSGDTLQIRYRDNGKADTHCAYVRTRLANHSHSTEHPKNCSTRSSRTAYQKTIDGSVYVGARWQICRTGHWKCHNWGA